MTFFQMLKTMKHRHTVYVVGWVYVLRPGNERLRALVDKWIADGTAKIVVPVQRTAGRGVVK